MGKIFKGKIAPNPMEYAYWVDLSADKYGNIVKSFNGITWVAVNDNKNNTQSTDISGIKTQLNLISTTLEGLSNYDDTELRGLIASLTERVVALEPVVEPVSEEPTV